MCKYLLIRLNSGQSDMLQRQKKQTIINLE